MFQISTVETTSILEDLLEWILLTMYIWGPVLIGFLAGWLAGARSLRLLALTTAVLVVLCVAEFFFPINTGQLSDMGWWFKSIFFFFESLFFATGLAGGILFKNATAKESP